MVRMTLATLGFVLATCGAAYAFLPEGDESALETPQVQKEGEQAQKEGKAAVPKKPEKETEAQRAVRNIALAQRLVDYGIENKSPMSLIVAAEILHGNQVENDPSRLVSSEGVEEPKGETSRTPETILAEAEKMIKEEDLQGLDDALAAAQAKIAERSRGAYPQAVNVEGHIHAGNPQDWTFHFHGHNHVDVHPEGWNPYVDLDLEVYDQFGNLVRYDRRPASNASVHWDGDGDYRIRVSLHGASHCDYHLHTN